MNGRWEFFDDKNM